MNYINILTLAQLSESEIRALNPNTSFPTPFSPPAEYAYVFPVPQPEHDAVTQRAQEGKPVLTNKGTWAQTWTIVNRYATPADEAAAVNADAESRTQALKAAIVTATQLRLDTFAQTRNYDGILSACTYATSAVPKFQVDGQTCVDARDATWLALYVILDEVTAGTRPMPASYSDIAPLLPELVWPA